MASSSWRHGLCAHARLEAVTELFFLFSVLLLREDIHILHIRVAGIGDHVRSEIQDLFHTSGAHVQDQTDPAGDALEVPDMGDRGGQFDVTHPLSSYFCLCDFYAAAVADDALIADALILSAVAFPVLGRSEDPLAEQAVALGLQRSVVDGFGLRDLTVRPASDLVRRGKAYL